ncbi:MAG: pectate lyase [Colwellia sp.]
MKLKWLLTCSIMSVIGLSGCSSDTSPETTPPKINHAPVANFSYQLTGSNVNFTNLSSDEDGDSLTYQWQLGADYNSTDFEPSYQFSSGSHVVILTVSDGTTSHHFQSTIVIEETLKSIVLQAESYDDALAEISSENGDTVIGSFYGGNYLLFEDVDLTEIKQISTEYASENNTSHLEFRVNSFDGLLIASSKLDSTSNWQTFQRKTSFIINEVSGLYDLYIVGIDENYNVVANLDAFTLSAEEVTTPNNNAYLLDEDSDALCDITAIIDDKHAGFNGSGFIDTENQLGTMIAWNINVAAAGIYSLEFNFANGGSNDRSGVITIDGAASQAVTLAATGGWDIWQTEALTVALEAGNNQIAITATTTDGLANIDQILISGNDIDPTDLISAGECIKNITPIHDGPLLEQAGNPVHSRYLKYKNEWQKSQADIILSYQYDNGGWPKNNEYITMGSGGSGVGATIDNGATTLEMTFFADLYRQDGDVNYRDAARKAMTYLLEAQYDTGGWPQFYPLKGGYADHVTFNDDAMSRVLTVLHHAVQQSEPFDGDIFTDEDREKFQQAINSGIDYILKSQWLQNGQLTVWCAQHGATDYQPKAARAYELESLSGSESEEIIGFLMTQPQSPAIKSSVTAALAWYNSPNTYLKDFAYDKNVEEKFVASPGNKMWYRFYNLTTNQGFFSDRDGGTYYDIMDISAERRNGYSWGGNYGSTLLNYAASVGY